jgi:hypothetical protein
VCICMLAIIFHQSGLIWQRCGAEFWQGTCSSHICEISLHMHNTTDTILKRHKSLDILSYVFLPFYDRDKSNIVDETNVDTWGTWTGDLSEFGTHARPDVALVEFTVDETASWEPAFKSGWENLDVCDFSSGTTGIKCQYWTTFYWGSVEAGHTKSEFKIRY